MNSKVNVEGQRKVQSGKGKVKASGPSKPELIKAESIKPAPVKPAPINLENLHSDLLAWYAKHKRDLPWRETRDPYKILLSEVLLQQTQVSRGLEYYARFLEAFPNVQALAAAPVEAVLKAWEGAGYYARARNLHRAAQQILEQGMPENLEGFLVLPGVGHYTAGAVCSIALGLPEPVVDGNVRRVFSRWLLEPNPQDDWLWTQAKTLLEREHPGDWNQAIMELGATVCVPKNPGCSRCPVSRHCQAFVQDRVAGTPAPKIRATVKQLRAVALVVGVQGRFLLEQRAKKGLLGGLHGFPLELIEPNLIEPNLIEPDSVELQRALEKLLLRFNLPANGVWHGTVSHTMTHRQLEVEVYAMDLAAKLLSDLHPDALFDPQAVALSKLDQKMLDRATRNVQEKLF
jgi:A/G-specific adenine glycosylase